MTGNPEVINSPVGLVQPNALVLIRLANFRVVGYPETDCLARDLLGLQPASVEVIPRWRTTRSDIYIHRRRGCLRTAVSEILIVAA